jgi:hypothetical protein
MEIVKVSALQEPGLPEFGAIMRAPAWLIRFTDDILSVAVALAVHDDKRDALGNDKGGFAI